MDLATPYHDLAAFTSQCQEECKDSDEACISQENLNYDDPVELTSLDALAEAPADDYLEAFRKHIGYVASTEEHGFVTDSGALRKDSKTVRIQPCGRRRKQRCYSFLTSIDVSNNCICSVKKLGRVRLLQKLKASDNNIKSFLKLKPIPVALRNVDFSYNRIQTLLSLHEFWALTIIDLSHNYIERVKGFNNLQYLRILNLSYNKINKLCKLKCPNLLTLHLNNNLLTDVTGLEELSNLRYINLACNKLTNLEGLCYLTNLVKLNAQNNEIHDMSVMDSLISIPNLGHLCMQRNPITSLDFWRTSAIYNLPKLVSLDCKKITPLELLHVENTFKPSFEKRAFIDRSNLMLERTFQSANVFFDVFSQMQPLPKLLLLVSTPRSQCELLLTLLKEKFKKKIYLGAIHSTATTVEGHYTSFDIPVSYEEFQNMRSQNAFLATATIMGRKCGFAASEVIRAVEKKASVFAAAVPLEIAISLTQWEFLPTKVLVHPSFHNVHNEVIPDPNELREWGDEDEANGKPLSRLPHPQLVSFGDTDDHAEIPTAAFERKSVPEFHSILKAKSFSGPSDNEEESLLVEGQQHKYFHMKQDEKPLSPQQHANSMSEAEAARLQTGKGLQKEKLNPLAEKDDMLEKQVEQERSEKIEEHNESGEGKLNQTSNYTLGPYSYTNDGKETEEFAPEQFNKNNEFPSQNNTSLLEKNEKNTNSSRKNTADAVKQQTTNERSKHTNKQLITQVKDNKERIEKETSHTNHNSPSTKDRDTQASSKRHHSCSKKRHKHKHKSKHKKHHHKHKTSKHRSKSHHKKSKSERPRKKSCCEDKQTNDEKSDIEKHNNEKSRSRHHSKNTKHEHKSKKHKHNKESIEREKSKHHRHSHCHHKSKKKKHHCKHHSKSRSKTKDEGQTAKSKETKGKSGSNKSSKRNEKTAKSKRSESKEKKIELLSKSPKLKNNLTKVPTDSSNELSSKPFERKPRHSLPLKLTREKIYEKIQEEYEKFHREHPGFFQLSVSTKNMCKCFSRIQRIVEDHLESEKARNKYKKDHIQLSISDMTEKEIKFMESRIQHFRQCTIAWTKGCDTNSGLSKKQQSLGLKSSSLCTDAVFRPKQCPRSILTTSLHSQSMQTEKMRALIQLMEREQGDRDRCLVNLPQL